MKALEDHSCVGYHSFSVASPWVLEAGFETHECLIWSVAQNLYTCAHLGKSFVWGKNF